MRKGAGSVIRRRLCVSLCVCVCLYGDVCVREGYTHVIRYRVVFQVVDESLFSLRFLFVSVSPSSPSSSASASGFRSL